MANEVTTRHPVGEGIGAAGGATGYGLEAAVNATVEDAYWRGKYQSRPYVKAGAHYAAYRDAYRYGWESRAKATSTWDDLAGYLECGWAKAKAKSPLGWAEAKDAVRDGWHRVERAMPGDIVRDGR